MLIDPKEMSLADCIGILNRLIEQSAVEKDFATLQKLDAVKHTIQNHKCRKDKKDE